MGRHRRCARITALLGDAVAARALGMRRIVSEYALRRALERIDEAASSAWMRPARVRGDSDYGNEGMLVELESRGVPYLLRLRQTADVQRLVARQFGRA